MERLEKVAAVAVAVVAKAVHFVMTVLGTVVEAEAEVPQLVLEVLEVPEVDLLMEYSHGQMELVVN
jgi:hypothetical protein